MRNARDPIAVSATNLAVCSVFLYRTLVGVGRALVVRTQTLVWTKRSTLLDAADFRGFDFIAERRDIAQVRFDAAARHQLRSAIGKAAPGTMPASHT